LSKKKKSEKKPIVAIIMGSDSDAKTMKPAVDVLKEFKIKVETKIVSAHRTPELMHEYAKSAQKRGIKVIIAGAGGAAHLPGMVASLTTLPVIGVPVIVGSLKGLDALLSIAQMPKGIPVATVAVDNAFNAGLLAARILGCSDESLTRKLEKYQAKLKKYVMSRQSHLKKLL
jgi:phosphoribosylaminoimidazole carboxylase PurE protein